MVSQTSLSSICRSGPYSRHGQGHGKRGKSPAALTAGIFLLLGACATGGEHEETAKPASGPTAPAVEAPARVGLIVPLSGSHAAIGQRMRDAARLALPEGQSPAMDVFDSAAPEGPAHAAQLALAAGDKIVLGPLMASDTQAVASVLQPANVPELAFTSDVAQAKPGVWVMGLTPEQQVRRLVDAARMDGRKRFAAFLPDSALGHAMGAGLTLACQEAGLDAPQIVYHAHNLADITQKMAELSHRAIPASAPAGAGGATSASIAAHSTDGPSAADPLGDSGGEAAGNGNAAVGATRPANQPSAPSSAQPVTSSESVSQAPLPFDALLLGDTGLDLARVIETLKSTQLLTPQLRILGPMLWRSFDSKLGDLHGAWYVAFDEMQRSGYVQSYQNAYHQMPSPVADFAYDSAALAGALIRQNKLSVQTLIQPKGYIGVDGLFHLRTDGRMIRALGVYQLVPGGGSQMIVPASRDLTSAAAVSGNVPSGTAQQVVAGASAGGERQPLAVAPIAPAITAPAH